MKILCKICNESVGINGFVKHITKHNLSEEDYFLKVLNNQIGKCEHCGQETKFHNVFKGYYRFCGRNCSCYSGNTVEAREKAKATCIKNFGTEYPMQSDAVKTTAKENSVIKYGVVSPNCVDYVKSKQHTLESDLARIRTLRESMIAKYNVDNCSKLKWVQDKKETTLEEHFGVKHTFQSHEIRLKSKKRFVAIDGITYDSSWEYLYANYLRNNNISFEYQPDVKFEYIYNNKTHYYFPDFKVGNEYVEIKGDHLFAEMQVKGTAANAKYECMLKNNVKILLGCDLQKLGIILKRRNTNNEYS